MNIIELKNIFFAYEEGEPVLEGIDLEVERGECLLVLGDNGAGKTTLFRILNGLSFPKSGSYSFKGTNITESYLKNGRNAKGFHKEIGYLFQNTDTMLFNSSVYDEVAFGPRQMGLSDEEVNQRTEDMLKLFGIEALRDKVPYHLSGGQKKMVALASVISLNPEVLVLDEPFAGLDRRREAWLLDFLKELKGAGKTLVIASHKPELLESLKDKEIELI